MSELCLNETTPEYPCLYSICVCMCVEFLRVLLYTTRFTVYYSFYRILRVVRVLYREWVTQSMGHTQLMLL